MTDREMLEFAAKAAGLPHKWIPILGKMLHIIDGGNSDTWNPLADDGDALRLAVSLGFLIAHSAYRPGENAYGFVGIAWYGQRAEFEPEKFTDDPYAATRRAIVRAAAEIGRRIK